MSATEPGIGLAAARARVTAAMAEAHTAMRVARSERRVTGWLQCEDGSWSLVDDLGSVGPAFAYGPYHERQEEDDRDGNVFADADAAFAVVDAQTVIDVDPLYTPALQRLLEIAERIARDSGATTVDVAHVEIALARHRIEGNTR
ncbi:hypothetical protein GCM10011610_29850 [Nocardia rhizosphaerihabitans]|uniref:Uncharacterized protein n=1 Tax=Nocardia rhizosphaerihabitans TaxID=1691570 RepID=A0ABQ2KEN2_9NOCA|nr:hypothetical protein GCM10011610_29850 [Nocardia rhizosphaerihabitans]